MASMPAHRQSLVTLLVFTIVLTSMMQVPFVYHGQAAGAGDGHVHLLLHRHDGHVHVHIHEHDASCQRDGTRSDRSGCDDSDLCEADHTQEFWLRAPKPDGVRGLPDRVRPVDGGHVVAAVPDAVGPRGTPPRLRAPPRDASRPDHLQTLRTVILRL